MPTENRIRSNVQSLYAEAGWYTKREVKSVLDLGGGLKICHPYFKGADIDTGGNFWAYTP